MSKAGPECAEGSASKSDRGTAASFISTGNLGKPSRDITPVGNFQVSAAMTANMAWMLI